MGRLAAGRYATNKRLSDVSTENLLDTFSYTSAEGRLPRLKGQRAVEEKVRRTGLDGVPRTARKKFPAEDPMAIRWARYRTPSPSADLRERMRSASPFMQSEQAKMWGTTKSGGGGGGGGGGGAAGASARGSARHGAAKAAVGSSVPWKSTSNEDLFPYACKRCNVCTAYQNGVSEVCGTSLKMCPWVISMDRSVRQVNAHFAGYERGEPEPDPARESTYMLQCRSGLMGADEPEG
jgi:hypothetical protein